MIYGPTVLHLERKDPPLQSGGSMCRPQAQHWIYKAGNWTCP